MANINQLLNTERALSRLIRQVLMWTSDPELVKDFQRADYLLSEVRQAGYFLTDLECTPHLKEEATKRLVQAIINCK